MPFSYAAVMELRQLRYFVAVAEEGNISRAAQKIFLTQPALSRQIKQLEEELGHTLFRREAHSIHLTAAGESLLLEARSLLEHAERVITKIRSSAGGPRLRIAYAPSLSAGLLSPAIEAFSQKHPRSRVELLDLSSQEMAVGLHNDKIDLCVTALPPNSKMKWTRLIELTWKLAVNTKHPLAKKKTVTPANLRGEKLLGFCATEYPEYAQLVGNWLRSTKIEAELADQFDGFSSLMAAVESGLGMGLVALRHDCFLPPRVTLKNFEAGPEKIWVAAGYRPGEEKQPELKGFLQELLAATQKLQAARTEDV
jgi:DNA-binding transcriptional LysR family regulator